MNQTTNSLLSEPRGFTDFSDYPQNGFGLLDVERQEREDREENSPYDDDFVEGEPDLEDID